MTTGEPAIRCPHCQGQNIAPRGELWWCHDCQKSFESAAVELPPAQPPRPKRPPWRTR